MAFRVPFQVQLLHPTLVQPFDRPGWVYEEKVDGWRMVAYKSGENVRLVSRRGLDHTARFAPLARSIAALYRTGGRTRLWLKSKVRQEGKFVVGGVVERREGWSLLVGSLSGDQLIYRGLIHF